MVITELTAADQTTESADDKLNKNGCVTNPLSTGSSANSKSPKQSLPDGNNDITEITAMVREGRGNEHEAVVKSSKPTTNLKKSKPHPEGDGRQADNGISPLIANHKTWKVEDTFWEGKQRVIRDYARIRDVVDQHAINVSFHCVLIIKGHFVIVV